MSHGFSEAMYTLRKRKGLSQRTVAAELHISQALLSHYENGAREPGLDFVRRACAYYGVSADYLLGLTDTDGRDAQREVLAQAQAELEALAARMKEALKETEA